MNHEPHVRPLRCFNVGTVDSTVLLPRLPPCDLKPPQNMCCHTPQRGISFVPLLCVPCRLRMYNACHSTQQLYPRDTRNCPGQGPTARPVHLPVPLVRGPPGPAASCAWDWPWPVVLWWTQLPVKATAIGSGRGTDSGHWRHSRTKSHRKRNAPSPHLPPHLVPRTRNRCRPPRIPRQVK